jgi:hypothetical protein
MDPTEEWKRTHNEKSKDPTWFDPNILADARRSDEVPLEEKVDKNGNSAGNKRLVDGRHSSITALAEKVGKGKQWASLTLNHNVGVGDADICRGVVCVWLCSRSEMA